MELKLVSFSAGYFVNGSFNRTKWNWNIRNEFLRRFSGRLLIVLNGIETSHEVAVILRSPSSSFNRTKWNWNQSWPQSQAYSPAFNRTKWNWNHFRTGGVYHAARLLIVLNGIETLPRLPQAFAGWLLIVLNGIETRRGGRRSHVRCRSFNRTKWNWNKLT